MQTVEVNVMKLSEDAVIPNYAHEGDAGLDLTATSKSTDEKGNIVYGTGLAFAIPRGYVGLVFPRSSNAKKDLWLTNSVGVIDSGYRGEVTLKYRPSVPVLGDEYEVGDRVGQLVVMPFPRVRLVQVASMDKTERGTGGYGSTGK